MLILKVIIGFFLLISYKMAFSYFREPVLEPVLDPVLEPLLEQVLQPGLEPVLEPFLEPVLEPGTVQVLLLCRNLC